MYFRECAKPSWQDRISLVVGHLGVRYATIIVDQAVILQLKDHRYHVGTLVEFNAQQRSQHLGAFFELSIVVHGHYEHPVVLPHVSHFMQVPLRTSVKFMHSPQASPS